MINISKDQWGYLISVNDIKLRIRPHEYTADTTDVEILSIAINKLTRQREINAGNGKVVDMELYAHLRGRHKDTTKGK